MKLTSSGAAKVTFPADDQILLTREFNAPRQLVYQAWTTPELVRRWWPGHRGHMKTVDIDRRVGGGWRYVLATDAGFEFGFHGEYREIVPDERIVATEVFEAMPGGQVLDTVTFSESDGRTTLRLRIQASSERERDAMLSSGMEVGLQEQLDMLEEVTAELA